MTTVREEEALEKIADALYEIAQSLHALGINNAGTSMGAAELFIKGFIEKFCPSIDRISEAILYLNEDYRLNNPRFCSEDNDENPRP